MFATFFANFSNEAKLPAFLVRNLDTQSLHINRFSDTQVIELEFFYVSANGRTHKFDCVIVKEVAQKWRDKTPGMSLV